jgi:hypothetical protein
MADVSADKEVGMDEGLPNQSSRLNKSSACIEEDVPVDIDSAEIDRVYEKIDRRIIPGNFAKFESTLCNN